MSGESPQDNSNPIKPSPPEPTHANMSTTSTPVSEFSGHPTLKTGTIEQLRPPGPDSNYSEWSWVLDIHFRSTGVSYLLDPDEKIADLGKAKVSFEQDNLAICAVIAKTIHPGNIRYVRKHNTDARGLWCALKAAHQDTSTGGVMYWLRKLTVSRMTGSDVTAHLDDMSKIFERLSTLVSNDRPLTIDDIYSAAILTSLPPDWLACVSSMMNEARINPGRLIQAIKQEDLRRKARSEDLPSQESAAKTNAPQGERQGGSRYFCTYCKKNGHSLERCHEAASILAEHRPAEHSESKFKQTHRRRRGKGKPEARAGQTTVVELGGTGRDDESDYSGSDDESYTRQAKAGNAVAVLQPTLETDSDSSSRPTSFSRPSYAIYLGPAHLRPICSHSHFYPTQEETRSLWVLGKISGGSGR
ncbi:hypothetical protein PCASD_16150 [Puccinia coronata f. sp. avenae]|uniref:CCHC-type domain-containing protein n=1 Tax=Puccinia coronata f. sp. avenae TaxID=200324 RepID=A0A2N5TAR5_9BASI|nr:hypothetical protein PCASD_16150 [Puccinia coronata f. sp. avenae]